MARRRRRPDFVPQMEITDCGAACLAMSLSLFGISIPLRELRSLTGTGRDGVTARTLVAAARHLGVDAAGVRLTADKLTDLPPGSILHWNASHFVVLAGRSGRRHLVIYDPELGRRMVPLDEVRSRFSGTAIILRARGLRARGAGAGRTVRRSRQRWLASFVGRLRVRPSALIRVAGVSVVLRALAVALPVAIGLVVERQIARTATIDARALLLGAVAVATAFGFASIWRGLSLIGLTNAAERSIAREFMGHMVDLPYQFFQKRSTGDLMMRVGSMSVIRETITAATLSSGLDGLFALVYLGLLVKLDAALALLAVACVSAEVALLAFSLRPMFELSAEMIDREARTQSYLAQLLFGMQTLKVAGAERRAFGHWEGLLDSHLEAQRRRSRVATLVDTSLATIQFSAPLAALGLGVARVRTGALGLGEMLGAVTLLSALVAPVAGFAQTALRIALVRTFAVRMLDIFETPREQEGSKLPALTISGQIDVVELSFRYSAAAPDALRDVSLSIPRGSFVALVGRSGSGKSTLASLLVGLFSPTSGSVCYDGRGVESMDIRCLRSQIGVVTQDTVLFPGTVADNVSLLDPDLSRDRLEEACRLACIHDEIAALPMGYQTLLAEGGAALAGGQRQRLAIARALVRDSAVLVLDEATTALDATLERRIVRNLRSLPATKLVITHRIPAVVEADLIVVMKDGRVVEQGTHASLWAAGAEYRSLAEPWFGIDAEGPQRLGHREG